jgi:D-beta-D-heptose 7-phosphate kinase/D-beta-D-heptose 1-phosphate adenosyltransferase
MQPTEANLSHQSQQLTLSPHTPKTLALMAPEILVVGDSMLRDETVKGHPGHTVAAGAAGIATALTNLGANVELVSVCGTDPEGVLLRRQLAGHGVGTAGLVAEAGRRTPVRLPADAIGTPLGRARVTRGLPMRTCTLRSLTATVTTAASHIDCVVVGDYRLGVAEPVRHALAAARDDGHPLIVKTQEPKPWAPLHPDLVTSTTEEASRLLTIPLLGSAHLRALRRRMTERSGARLHLVTLNDGGTLLLGTDLTYRTWSARTTDQRTEAAMDTVVAAFTLGLVADLPPTTSAELAQTAADLTANLPNSHVCTTARLAAHLADHRSAALPYADLAHLCGRHRRAGHRIVLACGSFDLPRTVEVGYLNQAKQLGDVLVVAVHSDNVVRQLNSGHRPLYPAAERASAVATLSCVDHVTITDEPAPATLLDRLRPDLYLNGCGNLPAILGRPTTPGAVP